MPRKKKVLPAAVARVKLPRPQIPDLQPRASQATGSASAAPRANAQPAPAPDTHLLWQEAHDALEAALEQGNRSLDQTVGEHPRKLLNAMLDTISDELTALNREDMQNHTISLQAAAQQLGGGITRLKQLRAEIAEIASTLAETAKVVGVINTVLSGVTSFLATFSAL